MNKQYIYHVKGTLSEKTCSEEPIELVVIDDNPVKAVDQAIKYADWAVFCLESIEEIGVAHPSGLSRIVCIDAP